MIKVTDENRIPVVVGLISAWVFVATAALAAFPDNNEANVKVIAEKSQVPVGVSTVMSNAKFNCVDKFANWKQFANYCRSYNTSSTQKVYTILGRDKGRSSCTFVEQSPAGEIREVLYMQPHEGEWCYSPPKENQTAMNVVAESVGITRTEFSKRCSAGGGVISSNVDGIVNCHLQSGPESQRGSTFNPLNVGQPCQYDEGTTDRKMLCS